MKKGSGGMVGGKGNIMPKTMSGGTKPAKGMDAGMMKKGMSQPMKKGK